MRVVRPSSEDEMVATFLAGELGSERFGATLSGALEGAGAGRALVEAPDVDDDAANALRRRLLAETRGYGRGEGLFARFPDDVSWDVVALRPEELAAVRYIDYDYWIELSGGTRAPADAARMIVAGIDVFGVSSRGFLDAAAAYVPADAPELIVVTAGAGHPVVVLEGHVRLTVYALRPALVRPSFRYCSARRPGSPPGRSSDARAGLRRTQRRRTTGPRRARGPCARA